MAVVPPEIASIRVFTSEVCTLERICRRRDRDVGQGQGFRPELFGRQAHRPLRESGERSRLADAGSLDAIDANSAQLGQQFPGFDNLGDGPHAASSVADNNAIASQGLDTRSSTAEEFGRLLASDIERWAGVVQRAGVRVE